MSLQHVTHTFEPVFDEHSRILILGSFPSVKSRQQNFYYGHPQNRFWKVLARLFESEVPITVEEKKAFLLKNGIAVWDVIHSCQIEGSSDSSIRDVVPCDVERVLEKSNIQKIYVNGGTAKKLYDKYLFSKTKIEGILLPSSSPANARYSLERLVEEWRIICQ